MPVVVVNSQVVGLAPGHGESPGHLFDGGAGADVEEVRDEAVAVGANFTLNQEQGTPGHRGNELVNLFPGRP
jgi:hypothetical protein